MTTAEDIKFLICSHYNLEPWKLTVPFRSTERIYIRNVTAFMLRKQLELTYSKIGHSLRCSSRQIMRGCQSIEREMDYCPQVKDDVAVITDKIFEWEESRGVVLQ